MKNGKWIYKLLFIIYIIVVGRLTGIFDLQSWGIDGPHSFNLIPFSEESLSLIGLNIVLFIPMGFFFAMYLNEIKKKLVWSILIAFIVSAVIETIQFFFVGRLADIDDILANTLGGVIGFGIYRLFFVALSKVTSGKKAGLGSCSIVLALLGMFFGTTFPPFICYGDMILARVGIPIWSGN